jgi:mycofactocin system transcriptional regulator
VTETTERSAARATSRRGGLRGRPPSTSRGEIADAAMRLFVEHGFDETTVDEIGRAVGINRRTLFRYYDSKNDIVWGEFSEQLDRLHDELRAGPDDEPVLEAVRRSVIAFNDWGPDSLPVLRVRMDLITTVPALQAHSTLRYADWCQVIADYVAERLGVDSHAHVPQVVAQAALGVSIATYRVWVRDGGDLLDQLDDGFRLLATGFPEAALRAEA